MKNPYAKSKTRPGSKAIDQDDQKKETSNSVRTVLDRWMGARKPKFRKKEQTTAGAEQGAGKAWAQVGISRFFTRKTDSLP
jgi:hypothetical protein